MVQVETVYQNIWMLNISGIKFSSFKKTLTFCMIYKIIGLCTKILIKAVGIETDLLTKILIIKNFGSHRLIRSLWEPLCKCISYFSHSFRNDSHISFQKDRIDSFADLLKIGLINILYLCLL